MLRLVIEAAPVVSLERIENVGKKVKHPKTYVLSVRVSKTEWARLQQLRQSDTVDVSSILRCGLNEYLKNVVVK